jgi:hypothetical protein
MPRIRTIDPHFPQTASLSRVSREARLFFILLWTVVDDAGRLRLNHERLKERLYPLDEDAPSMLPVWIGELESARCIELYRVDDVEYLRVRGWRQLQKIQHPTRSRLPSAPHEIQEIQEIQEILEESPPMPMKQASEPDPQEEAKILAMVEAASTSEKSSPERVRGYLEVALVRSMVSNAPTAPARYLEMLGRDAGMWGGVGATAVPKGSKEPDDPEMSPSPAEILGLPMQRSGS